MKFLQSLAVAVIAVSSVAPQSVARDAKSSNQDPVSVLVQTAALKRGSLPRLVTAYGVAKTIPSAQESVVAQISSMVAAVHVRVGQAVRKGAPLLELSPTPSTRAAYAAALSAQRTSADTLVRTRQLVGDLLATGQQLAAAEKADSDARAALRALEAQGAAGPTVLRAEGPAVVTAVGAAPNSMVAEGAVLLELARPNGLVLSAGVVPAQAASIEPGNEAVVQALGRTSRLTSRVALRGAVVDAVSGLVPIEISLPADALLPGETAQVSIKIGEAQGFVVPHAAILVNEQGGPYVVQVAGGVAKTVPVRILATAGEEDAVDGRLELSAPLVVAGNHQLQDGMKVRYANEAAGARP